MDSVLFHDRRDAGRKLADALHQKRTDDMVIMALPRGGVPVGFEAARRLNLPLGLLMVRKIGVLGHREVALGAVVDGDQPQLVLNPSVTQTIKPRPNYLAAAVQQQLAEIQRQRKLYCGGQDHTALSGRSVIVIDDGIATGATMRAALQGVMRAHPQRLILAVPVAPSATIESLANECDEIICLHKPASFTAVGQFYNDFSQVTDAEVIDLLAEIRAVDSVNSSRTA